MPKVGTQGVKKRKVLPEATSGRQLKKQQNKTNGNRAVKMDILPLKNRPNGIIKMENSNPDSIANSIEFLV